MICPLHPTSSIRHYASGDRCLSCDRDRLRARYKANRKSTYPTSYYRQLEATLDAEADAEAALRELREWVAQIERLQ